MFEDIYFVNFLKIKFHKLKRMISLPRKWMVLDVGSGDGPFPRADVSCDKYVFDTDRVSKLIIDRPFVMGDITALPFLDKSFDFVFCSHVLEHVDRPDEAIREIMRVGKSGYIELPSEFQEKIQSTAVHKWYVKKENDCLVFRSKEREVFDDYIQQKFRNLIDKKDRTYLSFFFSHNYDLFNLEYYWNKEIKFKILGQPRIPHSKEEEKQQSLNQIIAQLDKTLFTASHDFRSLLKVFIKKFFTKIKNTDLIKYLACPYCKNGVRYSEPGTLVCTACNRKFNVYKNVPVMLKDVSR